MKSVGGWFLGGGEGKSLFQGGDFGSALAVGKVQFRVTRTQPEGG